jgi:hypothetical protein
VAGILPMTAGVQKLDDCLQERPPKALQGLQHMSRQHKTFSGLAKWWQGWRLKKLEQAQSTSTRTSKSWRSSYSRRSRRRLRGSGRAMALGLLDAAELPERRRG